MLIGQNGGQRFRSAGGGGQWTLAAQTSSGLAVSGNIQTVKIPQNMAADFVNRQWNIQVPAIGVRVQGTLTADAGVSTLKCSRLQRGSFVNVQLDSPKLTKKYYQTFLDLARWSFAGELVNGPAMQLDQHMSTPGGVEKRGIHPEYLALPDYTLGAGQSSPLSTFNPSYHPGRRTDAYWRALEGLLNVRAPGGGAQTVDDFFVIPLCAYMGDLVSDSIPLDTMCDNEQPWQINCQMNRDPTAALTGFAGGSFVVSTVSLYVFAVPLRPTDKRVHGMPWQFRNVSRSAGDLKYNDGEVILFSGTLPATVDGNVTDTVDGAAYKPGIVYGEFSGDFAQANYLDWYVAGSNYYPRYYKDRGPRHQIEEIWNRRKGFQTVRYPGNTGVPATDTALRSARALGGTTPPVTLLAPKDLSTLLGPVSPYPCRMIAQSALEMKGFPGFGSLDAGCGAATVKLEGNWDFSSGQYAYNSLANMVDIILNNSPEDRTIIEDLGQNCCKNGTVTFFPTLANPDSPSKDIVAGKVTSFVQSIPDAIANTGIATMASSGMPRLASVAPKP